MMDFFCENSERLLAVHGTSEYSPQNPVPPLDAVMIP